MQVQNEDHRSAEQINVKLCVLGDVITPAAIRLEFTSDSDLFFGFQFDCSEMDYDRVRNDNQLEIGFDKFLSLLKQLLQETGTFKHGAVTLCNLNLD